MVSLQDNHIKKELESDKASTEVTSKKDILKDSPKTNFKTSFEEAMTPEALRNALYKKVDDLWGK